MGKRVNRETPIHKAVLRYLQATLPGAIIHHSPNELDGRGKRAMLEVVRKKQMGMRPGWPDLEMMLDGKPYFFEVKAEGNYQAKTQKDVQADLEAQGIKYAVVRSIDDVREYLTEWGLSKEKGPL